MGAVLLLTIPSPSDPSLLEYILDTCDWTAHRAIILLLLDRLLEPNLSGRYAFQYDLALRGDEYWLRKVWSEASEANVASIAADLMPIVMRHLAKAHSLLETWNHDSGADYISMSRSAVEQQSQDSIDSDIDILIDVCRDTLISLLVTQPLVGRGLSHRDGGIAAINTPSPRGAWLDRANRHFSG